MIDVGFFIKYRRKSKQKHLFFRISDRKSLKSMNIPVCHHFRKLLRAEKGYIIELFKKIIVVLVVWVGGRASVTCFHLFLHEAQPFIYVRRFKSVCFQSLWSVGDLRRVFPPVLC